MAGSDPALGWKRAAAGCHALLWLRPACLPASSSSSPCFTAPFALAWPPGCVYPPMPESSQQTLTTHMMGGGAAGWAFPWGLRARLAELLLRGMFDTLDEGQYTEQRQELLDLLQVGQGEDGGAEGPLSA